MTFSPPHSRSQSLDEGATGSAYRLILDHVLTYPATFEIPLRTMYSLNAQSGPHSSLAKSHHSASSTSSAGSNANSPTGHSPSLSQTAFQDRQATQTFTENLMAQIAQCSNQPTSLPPNFTLAFLRRCFPPELVCVDFPQALTGLDYLKDLETRRRREVSGAMARLGVDRAALESDSLALEEFPGVRPWLKTIEAKEHKIDALYTQLYIGLRRWIIINELSLLPFHKHNCVAMLNTLYPPMQSTPPTSKLSHKVLKDQREAFFKYISWVEKYGPQVLGKLMQQGSAPSDDNGWAAVTRCLNQYLQLAMSIIYDCSEIVDAEDLEPKKSEAPTSERPPRKADSGISFTSNVDLRRPSSQDSSKDGGSIDLGRPKTSTGGKGGSALEKLARGLRTLGRTRVDATEIISDTASVAPSTTGKTLGLRKMRSMGALDRSSKKNASKSIPSYDADEMRGLRLRHEANALAAQKFGRSAQP